MTIRDKLRIAMAEMNAALVEREEEVTLAFTAAVSRESLLLVGPPGVAKSLLSDSMGRLMDGKVFSVLGNKFMTPEDLVGPIDLLALEKGEYRRVTSDTVVDAHVFFIDEVWKGSSASLNLLLKILNEKKFKNGKEEVKLPLKFTLAASNEWPNSENGGQELKALSDRFLIRKAVRDISDPYAERVLVWGRGAVEGGSEYPRPDHTPKFSVTVTPDELDVAVGEAAALKVPLKTQAAYERILRELRAEGVEVSGRRRFKATGIAKAYAYLQGADQVEPEHLEVLAHVLWDVPEEQPEKAAQVVMRVACPDAVEAVKLMAEADDVVARADKRSRSAVAEALDKVEDVLKRAERLKPGPRTTQAVARIKGRNDELLAFMLRA